MAMQSRAGIYNSINFIVNLSKMHSEKLYYMLVTPPPPPHTHTTFVIHF
jgi:hypothetical protein